MLNWELKSINIYFTGQVNKPELNLIHPFSDIFTAISPSRRSKQ